MNVESIMLVSTCRPGGVFSVRYTLENDSQFPEAITAQNLLTPYADDYRWWITGPGVVSAVAGTEAYGQGSINDTITVPAGVTATLDLEVITNAKRLPLGSSLAINTVLGGTSYNQIGIVLNDLFESRRGNHDLTAMLAAFFGLKDSTVDFDAYEIQDLLNRGLRFRHVLKDLADRRGFPITTDAAGRTLLGDSAGGVGGRIYYGSYVTASQAYDFDLSDLGFLTAGEDPGVTTNEPPGGGINGWGTTP